MRNLIVSRVGPYAKDPQEALMDDCESSPIQASRSTGPIEEVNWV